MWHKPVYNNTFQNRFLFK